MSLTTYIKLVADLIVASWRAMESSDLRIGFDSGSGLWSKKSGSGLRRCFLKQSAKGADDSRANGFTLLPRP